MATEYASSATDWAGSVLEVSDTGSPENWTAIAELTQITFGDMTTEAIDVTHLLSPNAHKEKIPGNRDTGAFGISGNWLPENATQSNSSTAPGGLVYNGRTRTVKQFRIVLGNSGSPSTIWGFRGFISSFKPGDAANGTAKKFTAAITPSQDVSAALP